jgi:hypothetical protein
LGTRVYRKPTQTGRYVHYESRDPAHVKRGVLRSLVYRTSTVCQRNQDCDVEIDGFVI